MKRREHERIGAIDENGQRIKSFWAWVSSIRGGVPLFFFIIVSFFACGPSEIKPADIYPEDMCSQCRMAISDQSFAAEIVTESEEVFKFDEIGCMEKFKAKSGELKIAALFVKDYETKKWIPFARSTIVQTGLKTPMSSGKVAFADSSTAKEFLEKFSVNRK